MEWAPGYNVPPSRQDIVGSNLFGVFSSSFKSVYVDGNFLLDAFYVINVMLDLICYWKAKQGRNGPSFSK